MDTLYEKLQLAARNNISAEEVRMMIEIAPVLDTKNERDKNTFLMADFELSEGSDISLLEMKKSLRVIYWKIEDNQNEDTIAGLAWPVKNKAIFFSGKVLDP